MVGEVSVFLSDELLTIVVDYMVQVQATSSMKNEAVH